MAGAASPSHPLLQHAGVDAALAWLRVRGAQGLATDSRRVRAGDAFIAWPGHGVDGRQFVPSALQAGAVACLVEADGAAVDAPWRGDARVSTLPALKAATGELASRFHGEPSQRLSVVAVTGTNGKTSCAWWVAQALSLLGRRCGLVGTLGVGEPPSAAAPDATVVSTGLTTPDPVTLQSAFADFAKQGFAACAIEASSIGLVEHRLAGTRIAVALFTNFTRDHLDFHGDMDAYWEAKAQLFAWPGLAHAVLNIDDPRGSALAARLAHLDVWACSAAGHPTARLRAQAVRYQHGGLAFEVHEGGQAVPVQTALIGDYNVSNLLAVIGGLRALGVPLHDAAAACSRLQPVPGRMQRVGIDGGPAAPVVVVDYAHTPDALEKALHALRPFADERGGRLWVVFGCGGNRDATKRPLMGAIAQAQADQVVLTSDNPRFESPADILSQVRAGMRGGDDSALDVIEDRQAAIAQAVARAAVADVVLLAGKGHEAEQEVAGVKRPFSDVLHAQDALAQRSRAA